MWRYLGEHPQVFMAPKELQFFTEFHGRGTDWYRSQFANAAAGQKCGEATADYLARAPAMIRLRKTIPGARLIALLRNPVDRAWSHYWLLRERGRETRPFHTVVEEEIATLETDETSQSFSYLSHGLYDVHLGRVLELFPKEQLFSIVFESMVEAPAATFASACNFLGLDPGFRRGVQRGTDG